MSDTRTLFLAGDVMIGRGVDQILAHSVDPGLHEPYVRDARTYVELAEGVHGPLRGRPVAPDYVWGEALEVLERVEPVARIVNLETALTTAARPWPDKGIHYRSHPKNVACLSAAGLDCCVLANNHVLDWGRAGLRETLSTLEEAGIAAPGAGANGPAAEEPASLEAGDGPRILVFAMGSTTSGIPPAWAAKAAPGVCLLPDLSPRTLRAVTRRITRHRRDGDLVVVSIHWGGNWGYRVPEAQKRFARGLVESGDVDVVHGHSSHHPRGVEVYRGRPILYGCGDFLNDYEGIDGHERFRAELVLMYLPALRTSGDGLEWFRIRPFRIRRFRLEDPLEEDVAWLRERLDRECRPFGTRVERDGERALRLAWG